MDIKIVNNFCCHHRQSLGRSAERKPATRLNPLSLLGDIVFNMMIGVVGGVDFVDKMIACAVVSRVTGCCGGWPLVARTSEKKRAETRFELVGRYPAVQRKQG